MADAIRLARDGDDALLWIKVVPGAKRDEIVGPLGDRLKVRVSAPPESGRANRAVCALVARRLGVRPRDVDVERGATSAEKVLRARGLGPEDLIARLASEGPSA